MGIKTKIQWTDSTVNPTMGCDGCELWCNQRRSCYAGKLHDRWGKTNKGLSDTFDQLACYPGRMEKAARWSSLEGRLREGEPWKIKLPRMIFVSDMSDALSKDVSFEYLKEEVIDVAASAMGQQHNWQWLTKRPERMAEFAVWLADMNESWPSNLWAGTSLTTNGTRSRIAPLLKVPAEVRFLSVEPQIEDIDLTGYLGGIYWVIQGGESGNDARPFEVEWADKMRRQCEDADVPYFLKQLGASAYEHGEPIELKDGHGGDWIEWDERLRVRQFPRF